MLKIRKQMGQLIYKWAKQGKRQNVELGKKSQNYSGKSQEHRQNAGAGL